MHPGKRTFGALKNGCFVKEVSFSFGGGGILRVLRCHFSVVYPSSPIMNCLACRDLFTLAACWTMIKTPVARPCYIHSNLGWFSSPHPKAFQVIVSWPSHEGGYTLYTWPMPWPRINTLLWKAHFPLTGSNTFLGSITNPKISFLNLRLIFAPPVKN